MTDDEMFAAIAAQRLRLADRFDGFSDVQWNAASLCAGWRVRDVAGHLLSIIEIPTGRFIARAALAGGFNRFADKVARDIGARPPAELARKFRSLAATRFAPPVVGPIAPLTDISVHTRDIECPLGLASTLDPTMLATVLEYTCSGKAHGFVPAGRTKGFRFDAPDIGWSTGSGPQVTGPADAVLLAVTGRKSALADLTGNGAEAFASRLK